MLLRYLFPSRLHDSAHIGTRQYARIVRHDDLVARHRIYYAASLDHNNDVDAHEQAGAVQRDDNAVEEFKRAIKRPSVPGYKA